jgi:hypothetical protein
VLDLNVSIFGLPYLHMYPERQGTGKNRVPDIRTRAILPQWATKFVVRYMNPPLTQQLLDQLVTLSGVIMGVGDRRPEKGKSFGQYLPVPAR